MEELKKVYDYYQNLMKEAEEKHEADIDYIINGDDGAPLGDWTAGEVKAYEYALKRATVVYESMKVIQEEQNTGCLKK